MGAFAGQLCCRAHARAYHDHAVFDHHAPIVMVRRNIRQLDACAATIRLLQPYADSPHSTQKNDMTDCGRNVGLWETENAARMAVLGRLSDWQLLTLFSAAVPGKRTSR